jgi:DNA repair ATPase RecN
MGRKTELNQDRIMQICNKIKVEGNIPTVDRVRLEVGSGSRTTINRMIKEYEKIETRVKGVKKNSEMEQLFDQLIAATGIQYQQKIASLEIQVKEANQKVEHYLSESERHLNELEELKTKYDQITNENQKYQIIIENHEKEKTRLEAKLNDASNITILFKMLQVENETLKKNYSEKEAENQSIKKQFEQMINKIVNTEQQKNVKSG